MKILSGVIAVFGRWASKSIPGSLVILLPALLLSATLAGEPVSVNVTVFKWPGDKVVPMKVAEIVTLAKAEIRNLSPKIIHSGEEVELECPEAPKAQPPESGFSFKILPILNGDAITLRLSVQSFETNWYLCSGPIKSDGGVQGKSTVKVPMKFRTRKQPLLLLTTRLNEPIVVLIQSQAYNSNSKDWRVLADDLLFKPSINHYAIIEFTQTQPGAPQ